MSESWHTHVKGKVGWWRWDSWCYFTRTWVSHGTWISESWHTHGKAFGLVQCVCVYVCACAKGEYVLSHIWMCYVIFICVTKRIHMGFCSYATKRIHIRFVTHMSYGCVISYSYMWQNSFTWGFVHMWQNVFTYDFSHIWMCYVIFVCVTQRIHMGKGILVLPGGGGFLGW